MAGRECYHCKRWIEAGTPHDCWTTTEAALTRDLSDDLRDAWERLRETAAEFGEQRIYASHKSIMFSRRSCYFFVRPRRSFLEVWVFLDRPLKAPQVRRVAAGSKTRLAHLFHVRHRDEVEAPLTDWLRQAYDLFDAKAAAPRKPPLQKTASKATSKVKAGAPRLVEKGTTKKARAEVKTEKAAARARSRG